MIKIIVSTVNVFILRERERGKKGRKEEERGGNNIAKKKKKAFIFLFK